LASLLKAMHKGDHHVGKVPVKAVHTQALSGKVQELSERLDKAVREEKYEDAAQLRDELREAETKLKKSASVARSAD
jgi:protein arginine kinase activator